jgi:hypothetical protein
MMAPSRFFLLPFLATVNSMGFPVAGRFEPASFVTDGTEFASHQTVREDDKKAEFELVEPLDTAKGSMKGISAEYAFAMGVEWHIFRQRLLEGKPFTTLCLPENAARLVKMAERHSRFVEDRQIGCVGWTQIWVGDTISSASP